jgi:hypothetical protein
MVESNLRRDLARQVRTEARDESGRDGRTSLQDIGRRGSCQAIGAGRATIDGRIDEGELAILAVLGRGLIGGRGNA